MSDTLPKLAMILTPVLLAIVIGLVGWIGSGMHSDIRSTRDEVSTVRADVAVMREQISGVREAADGTNIRLDRIVEELLRQR